MSDPLNSYTFSPPEPKLISFATRDIEEFIIGDLLKTAYHNEESLSCVDKKYIFPVDFSLHEWAKGESESFIFTNTNSVILFKGWGFVSADIRGRSFIVKAYGPKEEINLWFSKQGVYGFKTEGSIINWMCGATWRDVVINQIPLDVVKDIPSAYPWIEKTVQEYAEGYFNSSSSILLLIGPPGTGKTSFLRSLILASGSTPAVTYEDNLLNEDGLFAYFIGESDVNMLIFEDADNYLGSRKNTNNTMMDRFLNVSNGLVSPMKGKKIIFTTNLPGVDDIDPALLRPGRCYDIIHFRPLTKVEATKVAEEVYGEDAPVLTESHYTLAEVTNLDRIEATKSKRKVGFM